MIYLVVVAHYGRISPFVDNLICAFHMPAFFMISGYLHKQMPVKQSVMKNFKRLIIPAFLFSLLCWGYYVALMALKGVPFTFDGYISKFLLGMIFYDRPNVTPPCGVIWFLQVLFISKVLLDIASRYGNKAIFTACVVCAVATWVWYAVGINDMRYQFLLQRTCASFPFVALGYVAKEKQLFLKFSKIGWLPYLLLALYLVGVVYGAGSLRDYEYCRIIVQQAEIIPESCIGCIVERRRAVVENEYFGFSDEGAGDCKPLALSAREVLSALLDHFVQSVGLGIYYIRRTRIVYGCHNLLVGGVFVSPLEIIPYRPLE